MPLPGEVINLITKTSACLYLPTRAETGLCRNHSQYTLQSVLKSEIWVLRMIDAASKVPSGVFDGHIKDMGNYDQCLRIEEPGQKFIGQHCLVDSYGLLPDRVESYFKSMAPFYYDQMGIMSISLCVPSSCGPHDITTHLKSVLEGVGLNTSTTGFEVFCSSKEPHQFRTKDWVAVGIYSTVMSLVILSTLYESNTSGQKSELICSFSVISNWRELKDTRVSSSEIACLNGLRVILAFFVMLTHRILTARLLPTFNYTSNLEMKNDPWMTLLWSSNLVAEIFFLIAGIVRAYSFLRNRRSGKQLSFFKQCIQRYFRVTPLLAVMVLFSSSLIIHMSNGPSWDRNMSLCEFFCNNLWWSNLLHISNCIGIPVMCRPETWFLAADFQLFVVSPLLLLPLYYRPKLGLLLLTGVYLLSTIIKTLDSLLLPIYPELMLYEGLKGERLLSTAHNNTVYRAATFVVGVALGYLILEVKSARLKITLSKCFVWLCWILSVLFLLITLWFSTLIIRPSYEDSPWLVAVYLGLIQRLWILGAAWIILACTLGYGGWLNKVLSWSGFVPLARLSFGMYLIHVVVQQTQINRMRQPYDMNAFDVVFQCIADYVVSAGLATVLYLAVEAPCSRVINHLLRPSIVAKAVVAQTNGTARNKQKNDDPEFSHSWQYHRKKASEEILDSGNNKS